MPETCDLCGALNRSHANFCSGCAAKLPGFAATGPSGLDLLKAQAPGPSPSRLSPSGAGTPASTVADILRPLLIGGLIAMALFIAWYAHVRRDAEPASPSRAEAVVLKPAFEAIAPFAPDLSGLPAVSASARAAAARTAQTLPTAARRAAADRDAAAFPEAVNGDGAIDTVTRFYRALAAGDGATATRMVIPGKRSQGPLSSDAMSAFYGSLAAPISVRSIRRVDDQVVEARYSYRATRTVCEGRALLTMESSGPVARIRSIAANC